MKNVILASFAITSSVLFVLSACNSDSRQMKIPYGEMSHNYGKPIHVARSVDGSHSHLMLEFFKDNQYIAYYSTDVGSADGVEYTGYYEVLDKEHFVLTSPIHGAVYFNSKGNSIYLPEGQSSEESMGSGLMLKVDPPFEMHKR